MSNDVRNKIVMLCVVSSFFVMVLSMDEKSAYKKELPKLYQPPKLEIPKKPIDPQPQPKIESGSPSKPVIPQAPAAPTWKPSTFKPTIPVSVTPAEVEAKKSQLEAERAKQKAEFDSPEKWLKAFSDDASKMGDKKMQDAALNQLARRPLKDIQEVAKLVRDGHEVMKQTNKQRTVKIVQAQKDAIKLVKEMSKTKEPFEKGEIGTKLSEKAELIRKSSNENTGDSYKSTMKLLQVSRVEVSALTSEIRKLKGAPATSENKKALAALKIGLKNAQASFRAAQKDARVLQKDLIIERDNTLKELKKSGTSFAAAGDIHTVVQQDISYDRLKSIKAELAKK